MQSYLHLLKRTTAEHQTTTLTVTTLCGVMKMWLISKCIMLLFWLCAPVQTQGWQNRGKLHLTLNKTGFTVVYSIWTAISVQQQQNATAKALPSPFES